MRSIFTFPLALLTVCAPLHADITVGPEGSGAQTDNINDAIFNADEGETIFVLPGTYEDIQVKRQSVRILGAGADRVTFAYSGDALFAQSSRIFDLTENQQVFISGVTFDTQVSTTFEGSLHAFDNQGRVYLHDCVVRSTTGSAQAALQFENCDEVFIDRCSVEGFTPAFVKGAFAGSGGAALSADFSRIRLSDSRVLGGSAVQSAPFFANGGDALVLDDCELALHGSELLGGDGFDSLGGDPVAGVGLRAWRSDVQLSGPLGTQVVGGAGQSADPLIVTTGGSAIVFEDELCTLVHSNTVAFAGGVSSDGAQVPALSLQGAPQTVELFQRPGLQTSAASVSPGNAFVLSLDGEPASAHAVALALGTAPTYTLATAFGDVILDPSSTTLLAAVSLDATGAGTLAIDLPAEPALTGIVGWFQSLQTGLGGGARVSLPTALVVGQ